MNRYVAHNSKLSYALVDGEFYCNEKCFNFLKEHSNSLVYSIYCVLCGANEKEISECTLYDDEWKMKPCTLEYHILEI